MKKYENLTKLEREKLATYQRYCINENMHLLAFSIFGLFMMLVGICTVTIFTSFLLVTVGIYLALIGLLLVAISLFGSLKHKKEFFLVFGYKDSMRDLFEIKLSDIKDVVIERKTIWRKK